MLLIAKTHKHCIYCKELKCLEEFPRHIQYKDNLDSRCRSCIKEHAKINGAKLFIDGTLVISVGYQWDGCSGIEGLPFYMDLVPDFKGTMRASLLHDVLCEMMRAKVLDIKYVHKANVLFKNEMKRNGFKGYKVYYKAVEKKCKDRIEKSIKERNKVYNKK